MGADISGITLEAMRGRHAALANVILHTPSVPLAAPLLGAALGAEIWLKLELLQHTGTFKARGALSNARAIDPTALPRGITAVSAGNHAIAAAWAARMVGAPARVVMLAGANGFRVEAARAEGAEVIIAQDGAAGFAEAERLARDEGMSFLHPFDGVDTVLGAAGVGLELLGDVPDLDAVIAAVGGGGLIGGVAAAVKALNPSCAVYGVEPEGADTMRRSLADGAPISGFTPQTIADSLAPPMALPMGLALAQAHVDDMVTVSDDAICAAMGLYQEQARLAVEPSAAAPLAALLGPLRARLRGRKVGLVVCGANIDATSHAALLARGQPHRAALLAGDVT